MFPPHESFPLGTTHQSVGAVVTNRLGSRARVPQSGWSFRGHSGDLQGGGLTDSRARRRNRN
jgi:hypothetical protein